MNTRFHSARRLAFAAGTGLFACAAVAVEITKDWTIAVPNEDAPAVQCAMQTVAEEIRRDIAEARGFSLPIVRGGEAKSPAIWLGAAAAERAGLMPSDLAGMENAYAEKGGDIYVFGRDRSCVTGAPAGNWWLCTLPTARAAARFLQDCAGVRFLQPGVTGTDVPTARSLTLADGAFSREKPNQEHGVGRYHGLMYDMANYIFGAGAYESYGGHSYPAACPATKHYKDHPEYFGLIAGKRVYSPGHSALCISNPEVQQLMVDEIVRKFDAGYDTVLLGQQDGFHGCECEACAAFGGEVAKGDWGEKLWILHADIARRVAKLRPGKRVEIMCYGPTRRPPKSFRKFPENVVVKVCYYTEDDFAGWKGYDVPCGFTTYVYFWGEYPRVGLTPKMCFARCAQNLRRFHRNRVHGIYRCGYGELYGLEGPAYWVFNRLLENPEADVNAAVTEYCVRSFGPAAPLMRRFYDRLDRQLQLNSLAFEGWQGDCGNLPDKYRRAWSGNALPMLAEIYTPDAIAEMESCLARSERRKDLTDRQRRRLTLVRLEWDYARNLGEIATLNAAYRLKPTKALFEPLGEKIRERNAFLDRLYAGGRNGAPRRLDGWPELNPFGGFSRAMLNNNGRMSSWLGSPLCWDVDGLSAKGVLPGADTKKYAVRHVAGVPDGLDFESKEWADVNWTELGGVQLQPISGKARFKALYDDEGIVFAVESSIADGRGEKAQGHDANIWSDDSLNLLLDATGTRDSCYHFIWTPVDGVVYDAANGMITDPLHPKYGKEDTDWNPTGVTYANSREGGIWKTRVKVPFAAVGAKPDKGEVWCFNVGREWNFGGGGPYECALWNPNFEDMQLCAPATMGNLVFE